MKKMRLKKWVKNLLVVLIIYAIGLGYMLLLAERAEQINRSYEYEENIK